MIETRLRIHLAQGLGELVAPLAEDLWNAPGDVLSPLWCVVPTTTIRAWLDQNLGLWDAKTTGGVAANIRTILPRDLALEIERMALGDEWLDFDTEITALRILGALKLEHYDEALRLAEAIDEVVRWRPHLLEEDSRGQLPRSVLEAMEALDFFESGAHVQRQRVLDRLTAGEVRGLSSRLSLFGLTDLASGPRFLELLAALGTQVEVSIYLPVPNVAEAESILSGRELGRLVGWRRDVTEALTLWSTLGPMVTAHYPTGHNENDGESAPPTRSTTLDLLKASLSGQEQVVHDSIGLSRSDADHDADESVSLIGAFGDGRQVEQARDAIFESIAHGVAPHEILVVSPDPTAFAADLERHWNYQFDDPDGGPRLAYELIEVRPRALTNRLGASLALLRMVGNYASLDQVARFVSMTSVAATLGLDLEAREQLLGRAREGKLIFGVTAIQRERFGIYSEDTEVLAFDVGTWERLFDAVAASSLYPPVRSGDRGTMMRDHGLSPVGEPVDLAVFASLLPLMRILESADGLRAAPRLGRSAATKTLTEWLRTLEAWMAHVAIQGSSGDDSFERSTQRLKHAIETVPGLDELVMTFEQFLELWDSTGSARSYSSIHGRRGVVVASLEAFQWAPFRVVCILGLDEEKLVGASLPSPIMALLPPGTEGRRPPGDPDPSRHTQGALLSSVLSATDRLIITFNVASEESGAMVEPSIVLSELLDALGTVNNTDAENMLELQRRAVRRHGFFDDHQRPRFDVRLRQIDESRAPKTTSLEGGPRNGGELTIESLATFFRDPLGTHLRHGRNVQFPRQLETDQTRPATSVDNLTMYGFRERFTTEAALIPEVRFAVEAIADGASYDAAMLKVDVATRELFRQLSKDTDLTGDVPPIFWLEETLKPTLDLFVVNRFFDEFDHEIVESLDNQAYLPVDLQELGELLLVPPHESVTRRYLVRRRTSDGTPSVLHFHPSPGKIDRASGRVTSMLLELLALRINHPSEMCRVVTYFIPTEPKVQNQRMKAYSIPKGARRLNPVFELSAMPEEIPAEAALDQLRGLVTLYRDGLEGVPTLFRKTSEAAAFDAFASRARIKASSAWARSSFNGSGSAGEQMDLTSRLLFAFSFQELRRKTDFDSWSRRLAATGRGAQWYFGDQNRRPAPQWLINHHDDFRVQRDEVQPEALAKAEEKRDDEEVDMIRGSRRPLITEKPEAVPMSVRES